MEQTFSYGLVNHQKDLLHDIYALRYQVYVNEWGFEKAEEHPGEIEYDEYDEYSIHYFARCKNENRIIGTARLIMNSELDFPICRHFDVNTQHEGVEKSRIGEISRLAVSKEYRRRAIDQAIFGSGVYDAGHIPRYIDEGRDPRRHCEHELIRGLYLAIYLDSKRRGLTHWYAVMARGLYVILTRWGIAFTQVGPAKDYHGLRAPYLVSIESIEHTLAKINPELLEHAARLDFNQFSSGNGPFQQSLRQSADLIVRRKGLRLRSNP